MSGHPKAGELVGHPYANAFPMIEGRERIAFRDDLKAHGIREPIVLHEGQVLDGRNRLKNGLALGLIPADADPLTHPAFRPFGSRESDGASAFDFVISLNLDGRRHLSESQRALVAANLEGFGHGGRRGAEKQASEQDADLQLDRKTLAERFNVSPRSVASARKVIDQGAPELVAHVEQGKLAVSVAEKLATLPSEQQTRLIAATSPDRLKLVAKQAMREQTEKRLANKQKALPTQLYGVIYADPAWRFEPFSRETGLDRAADNHYPTQATDEITALPVGTISANDCVLFLWATAPMLCDALRVVRFWGFQYKTHLIWDKQVAGTGYWLRNRHELLIIAAKGHLPAPAPGMQGESVIAFPAGRHSEKPEAAYELIESYFPNLPKIELNARIRRAGWDAWGLEAPEENSPEAASDVPQSPDTDRRLSTAELEDAAGRQSAAPLRAERERPGEGVAAGETATDTDEIISRGYAEGGSKLIERLMAATGLTANQVKQAARRMKLSNHDRQRAAVAEANKRRAGA